MNPVVDRVACSLYEARGRRPTWAGLDEYQRDGYRETVQEVLLAAMNAGLIIRELEVASGPVQK